MQHEQEQGSRGLPQAILDRFGRLPRWQRWWWGSGLALALAVALLSAVAAGSCLHVLAVVLLVLWAVPTVGLLLFWAWRRLTYRIGVRLLISYVLIGVLPFPMLLLLAGGAGYVLLGQYASAEFGDVTLAFRDDLVRLTEDAVAAAEAQGPAAARARLAALSGLGGETARQARPHLRWLLASGGDSWRSDNALGLEMPDWFADGADSGPFLTADGPVMAAISRRGAHLAAVLLPLGPETAAAWSAGAWYRVSFSVDEVRVTDEGSGIHIHRSGNLAAGPQEAGAEGAESPADEVEQGPPPAEGWVDRIWQSRWIYFLRPSPELRRWEDGSAVSQRAVTTLIRTSPREAAADLFRSPYEIGRAFFQVFVAIASMFLVLYLGIVFVAVLQIFAITRSTARLTRGTRKVQAGELDHRIPVKRRDQLGDLAVAFNQMTDSVKGMLAAVEEKERLKHELGLAREIQQSLLPARHLLHGLVSVHAFFRPAAEVGGDYFDLFPLDRGRLIVAVGDVAGHGLSTGLLMAMVKSAVATLVQEGHRGVELLERLNRFMLQQPREHRMVTLAVAEIDVENGFAEITNAAHPPVYLSGGSVREVMLPALPVGFPWRQPPPSERLELEPGSRLVFYSDGLVEAIDAAEEPFGYGRLRDFLAEHAELTSEVLMTTLLAALERHTGGRPLDDDLTILIIDCGSRDPDSDAPSGRTPPLPGNEFPDYEPTSLRDEERSS